MTTKQLQAAFVIVLSILGMAFAAVAAHGQTLTPVAVARPVAVYCQHGRMIHLAIAVDGTAAQVTAPGLDVVREHAGPGMVNLAVSGKRLGCFPLTVTATKDGKLTNLRYDVRVGLLR